MDFPSIPRRRSSFPACGREKESMFTSAEVDRMMRELEHKLEKSLAISQSASEDAAEREKRKESARRRARERDACIWKLTYALNKRLQTQLDALLDSLQKCEEERQGLVNKLAYREDREKATEGILQRQRQSTTALRAKLKDRSARIKDMEAAKDREIREITNKLRAAKRGGQDAKVQQQPSSGVIARGSNAVQVLTMYVSELQKENKDLLLELAKLHGLEGGFRKVVKRMQRHRQES